jgi:hypothetical protein
VVLVIALGTLIMFTPSEEEVTPADRGLVVDIRAVAAQFDDYTPDASRETLRRHRYFDRSFDIDYTYGRPDGEDGIYLKCTLTMEPTDADAKVFYRRLQELRPWKQSLAASDQVQMIRRNDLFRWGDQSRLEVIESAGRPKGNLFVARRGAAVFYLLVRGACFQRQEAFSSLVLPALDRIERLMSLPISRRERGEMRAVTRL